MSSFGDIRSIAQRPPGIGTWWDLCDAFESYEGAEPVEDRLLPYCMGQLDRWPRHIVRAMPIAWLESLAAGDVVPGARLANAITNWPAMRPSQLAGLARADGIESVRTLDLSAGISTHMMSASQVTMSAAAPRSVDALFAAALEDLLNGPLQGVEVMILGRSGFEAPLARVIGALPRLRSLTFEGCACDTPTTEALSFGAFESLEDLHIQQWSGETISVLCESRWWGQLESLSLRGCDLGDDLVQGVFDDPVMSNLRWLDLGVNRLSLDALCSLLTSPALLRLESLTLDRLGTQTRGWVAPERRAARARALAAALERSTLKSLTELGLRENHLFDSELTMIRSAMRERGVEFRQTPWRDQLT